MFVQNMGFSIAFSACLSNPAGMVTAAPAQVLLCCRGAEWKHLLVVMMVRCGRLGRDGEGTIAKVE